MGDNYAIDLGYTEEYHAECASHSLDILVRPGTDFDGAFNAWDTDGQEIIRINGWLWTFEKAAHS